MRHSPRYHRVPLLLLALAALLTAGLAGSPAAAGERDHLKCYDVVADERRSGTTKLHELFTFIAGPEEGCYIYNQARILCNAVAKNFQDDWRGPELPISFYTCYALVCPNEEKESGFVEDQFFGRVITIWNTRWLCAPARVEPADRS